MSFSDFFRSFILYVDESKKKEFEVTLHQINKNGVKRSILFLFRSLTSAEKNYWATKLKATTLVWAFIKLSQYFDFESFTVVTDHFALKTALQTKTTDRRSAKLNEWVMFLSTFLPRMKIRHRSKKTHQNANDLFRLPSEPENEKIKIMFTIVEKQFEKIFQFEVNQKSENSENFESKSKKNFIVIIANQSDFLIKIAFELSDDSNFEKIMTKFKNQIEAIKDENNDFQKKFQYYRLNTDTELFYLKNKFESNRLCISQKSQKRLLKYAHNEHAHDDVHRTYDLLLRSVYMPKMKKTIMKYVTTCFACQLFKSSRQLSYEQLQSIFFSKEFLSELNLNFIVVLPMTLNRNNAILTMTNRFSKYVKLISGKETLSAEKWKALYWKFIFKNWSTSTKLISDRDFKFNSDFWRTIFKQCEAALNMITIYHFSTNSQAERSNQIVETALKNLLIKKYEKKWKEILFHVEYSLNVFQNVSTEMFSFEVLYGIKSKDPLLIIIKTNEFQKEIDFMKKKR